jgi:hypothetical protein
METELLTTSEAAAFYRCSKAWLEKKRCEGGGPKYLKRCRSVLYRRTDLVAWLADREFASTSQEAGK